MLSSELATFVRTQERGEGSHFHRSGMSTLEDEELPKPLYIQYV